MLKKFLGHLLLKIKKRYAIDVNTAHNIVNEKYKIKYIVLSEILNIDLKKISTSTPIILQSPSIKLHYRSHNPPSYRNFE